ncbi:replication initiation protein [uncultured Gemmiger sp.]|uniref:replication initiation protein n=1 Tax=uncultured Gemmiger sp. TaxID=1623490 RepID=UPI0025F48A44|nr:replication initiation protein [uncultured Gemmiger sp.]
MTNKKVSDVAMENDLQTEKKDNLIVTFEERGNQTIVRKSNDLVQLTRNNLTLSQQRLMLHIFSMIKPEDTELPSYELSVYDFIKLSGMNPHSGALYKQVRRNIEELANAPVQWIKNSGTTTVETFRWINKVRIDEKKARMTITLDPVLKPHLVQLKTLYTTMDITYTMNMRSTYSIRIYELCKSYQNLYLRKKSDGDSLVWDLNMLYEQLSYTANSWSGFRRFALDKAKSEINGHTDIVFDYDVFEKKGQKVLSLAVTIEPENEKVARENLEKINKRAGRKTKKRKTAILDDVDTDDQTLITFDYVSAPETSIPYSFGKDRAKLKKEIEVKARLEQLQKELSPEEYNAVMLILDILATACCTIRPGDQAEDGGNVEVFGRMNAIILDCGGLTQWLRGVAPRYAREIIPAAQGKKAPVPYLTKILLEDMDNYRIYIFKAAGAAQAVVKQEVPQIYEAEFVETEPESDFTAGHLKAADAQTKKQMEQALRTAANEEKLLSVLSSGQQDAYQDIIKLAAYFCRRNQKGKDDGMMSGKANMQFVNALNGVLDKYGSLELLFVTLAKKLDYDVFWKECAKSNRIKNAQGLFQAIVEKGLLFPEMVIREQQSEQTESSTKGESWAGGGWADAFEE